MNRGLQNTRLNLLSTSGIGFFGEKRAIEVKNYLIIKGVSSSKIKVISYGEEKPIDINSNENAWKKNRRVEISLF